MLFYIEIISIIVITGNIAVIVFYIFMLLVTTIIGRVILCVI